MDKIVFLVVIHSKSPELTKTVQSYRCLDFKSIHLDATLVIWDNSVKGFGNGSLNYNSSKEHYFHTGNNERLSIVYNKVISEYRDEVKWLVILDDDSVLDQAYINSLDRFVKECFDNPLVNVAVPKIYNKGSMISPGFVKGVRGIALNDIDSGITERKDIVAMMSGTILNLSSSLPEKPFDERLSFYGVDTKFFRDTLAQGNKLYILQTQLTHDSALRDTTLSFNDNYPRLKNLLLSKKIIFSDLPFFKVRVLCYYFFFTLKTIIKRKDLRYIELLKLFLIK
ncbi:glycosyltransferase [Serratia sp. Res13-Sevr-LER1-36-b]|uniref:glycosyltransferase n=1 Tax=Serratia sp. Res13-Sevr-LER1-36-b TaxID=2777958 RepID=UPI0018A93D6B|nr:glycosyltransferase [Serratia sp. Res13-Sevr-LER1-36-b]